MIENLLETIQGLFINKLKMRVILATHSPTTVALSPEESIFVIENNNGQTEILSQSREKAVDTLSDGFITLNRGIELLDQVAKQKLNIFTEGKNTEYIKRAVELLSSELLARVKIIDTIKDRSGEKQLNVLYEFFLRLKHSNKVLFVYDCEVKKNIEQKNNTFYYVLPQNKSNQKVTRGIENMFPESLILGEHYEKTEKIQNKGSTKITFNKRKTLDHILANADKDDFKNFDGLIYKIKSILD